VRLKCDNINARVKRGGVNSVIRTLFVRLFLTVPELRGLPPKALSSSSMGRHSTAFTCYAIRCSVIEDILLRSVCRKSTDTLANVMVSAQAARYADGICAA